MHQGDDPSLFFSMVLIRDNLLLIRFAKAHLCNNYTRNWGIYAVSASVESQVLSFKLTLLLYNVCDFLSPSMLFYI